MKSIAVPDIGDFKDVAVIEVLIAVGDTIARDQPVAVLESDKATLEVPSPEGGLVAAVDIKVGDKVSAGSLVADVLHTPGHTEGSVCLYFAPEKKLIAGDTLFAGSIGRTDLPGGSYEKIMRSLHGPVLALPDETIVVPGHGPVTTIGEERRTNPFLVR